MEVEDKKWKIKSGRIRSWFFNPWEQESED